MHEYWITLSEILKNKFYKNVCENVSKNLDEKLKILGFCFCSFCIVLPMFIDFVNSNDWIGKIASKSIRLQSVIIQKKIWN